MIKVPGHRVMVKPKDILRKTAGGLVVVSDEKLEKAAMTRGTVEAIGPDAWKTMYINGYEGEPWAVIGDEVLYAKYVGFDVKDDDGTEYRLLNDEDIICVFPKEAISQGAL
jgi:co-chaperonin GroES (HSP10)